MSQSHFWFVRHGQTEYNRRGVRCGGDVDIPLTPRGEQQSEAVTGQLADIALDLIVSSPLIRARQTAAIIGRNIGCPVQIHPLLLERLLGDWNGMPIAETEALLRGGMPPPGGEPEVVFFERIGTALEELAPLLRERRTLIVSSKGVARMLDRLTHRTGTPADNAVVREYVLPEHCYSASGV